MSAIQKLMEQTYSWAVEAGDVKNFELSKSYMDDVRDFNEVAYLLSAGYTSAAAKELNEMDTAPREEMVLAIQQDYGNEMLSQLGWEVS